MAHETHTIRRRRSFAAVDMYVEQCVSIVRRLNNAERRKNNLFTALKRNERDKKKLVDTVLKQLRQLVNAQQLEQYS